ncbi:sugar ABC transporter permease [Acuticoccus sp. MNP-M23]|uniref:carbohydrate ABC transporter permease n=1 Tax=Acuticoccus sp. MNP-M23 TaxID=3072793 RepID=UPI002814F260|nr:sugar ABC transporter permease [Acuticoccus sp. MNP-M23]WMS44957.1 sugar ABC transporter permease [Acuticoccus sp. MNP-M23]
MSKSAGPLVDKGVGPIARRESRLAYTMILPTVAIVMAIVLLPLAANIWISFKPVGIADLRPPALLANERLRGDLEAAGDEATIQYRLRNSSRDAALSDTTLTDTLPEGLEPIDLDSRCTLEGGSLSCALGAFDPGARGELEIRVRAAEAYLANPINPRDSDALTTVRAPNVLTNLAFSLENYRAVFDGEEFMQVLWVTIFYTLFGTLGAIVLGVIAAQLLNRDFRGRSILRGLYLFPYVAPVIAMAFTWLVLFDPFSGTINAMIQAMGVAGEPVNFFGARMVPVSIFGLEFGFPLALAMVIAFEAWRYFPLSFLFILARMQSIPTDMYEAADMDGATPFQKFFRLSMPQIVGILAVLFLLRFIWTFNKFDDIFLLTGGAAGTRTLTVDVYYQGFAIGNLGAGAAVAVVIFVMLLIFALLYFRALPKGEGL